MKTIKVAVAALALVLAFALGHLTTIFTQEITVEDNGSSAIVSSFGFEWAYDT